MSYLGAPDRKPDPAELEWPRWRWWKLVPAVPLFLFIMLIDLLAIVLRRLKRSV